uniref:Homeobox domain-containing protein n=1 Tax=Taeniopygia guttata TaxID=59729 RepID=A0A674GWQ2_TAEGU
MWTGWSPFATGSRRGRCGCSYRCPGTARDPQRSGWVPVRVTGVFDLTSLRCRCCPGPLTGSLPHKPFPTGHPGAAAVPGAVPGAMPLHPQALHNRAPGVRSPLRFPVPFPVRCLHPQALHNRAPAAVPGAAPRFPCPNPFVSAGPSPPGASGPRPPCRKRRKSRTAFTAAAATGAGAAIPAAALPLPVDRDALAARLALSAAQVITWFQNRRAKLKRDLEELRADVASLQALPPPPCSSWRGCPSHRGLPVTAPGPRSPRSSRGGDRRGGLSLSTVGSARIHSGSLGRDRLRSDPVRPRSDLVQLRSAPFGSGSAPFGPVRIRFGSGSAPFGSIRFHSVPVRLHSEGLAPPHPHQHILLPLFLFIFSLFFLILFYFLSAPV